MRSFTKSVLGVLFLFFMYGCVDSNKERVYVQEVNGPAGNYAGATAFVPGMFADYQTIYTFDEKNRKWVGIMFKPDGGMVYESVDGIEEGSTYTITDGKMYVTDTRRSPTISLNKATKTTFEVTGEDNNGRTWDDTWYLELQFKPEMLAGKCYLSTYNDRGTNVKEKVCFTRTDLNTYTIEGTPKASYPYTLKYNAVYVKDKGREFTLYLMRIDPSGSLYVWYVCESNNYANNSAWQPLR